MTVNNYSVDILNINNLLYKKTGAKHHFHFDLNTLRCFTVLDDITYISTKLLIGST